MVSTEEKKLSNQVMLERMGVDPTAVNLKKEAEELDQLLESPTKSKAAFNQRILPKKTEKNENKENWSKRNRFAISEHAESGTS